jgi:hypothetical protein
LKGPKGVKQPGLTPEPVVVGEATAVANPDGSVVVTEETIAVYDAPNQDSETDPQTGPDSPDPNKSTE